MEWLSFIFGPVLGLAIVLGIPVWAAWTTWTDHRVLASLTAFTATLAWLVLCAYLAVR